MLRIIADERERPSGVPQALRALGVSVEYRLLDVADYLVGSYAVERKSVRDFVSSLYNGRLFDQAHRLGQAYDTIFLIVEGDIWEELGGSRNPRSLWGALISAVLDFDLNTFFAPNVQQTAQFLLTLGKGGRARRGGSGPPIVMRKPRTEDIRRVQVSILSSIPGIGPRMANQLLEYFGSLRKIFAASVTEISVGARLGKVRALGLARLLDAGSKGSKAIEPQTNLNP